VKSLADPTRYLCILNGLIGDKLAQKKDKWAFQMSFRRDGNQRTQTAEDVVAQFVAKVGSEATAQGLRLLGAGHLAVLVPQIDAVEAEAREVRALNGAAVEFEDRLSALESQHG